MLAFEPKPWVFRNASVRLSDLPNVTLVIAAVEAAMSVVELYFSADYSRAPELHSGSAWLVVTDSAVEKSHSVPVFQVSIREVLEPFDKVGFFRINIEGAEAELWPAIEKSLGKLSALLAKPMRTCSEERVGMRRG